MFSAGIARRRLTRTLNAAYADGLISEQTFARRLDQVLKARLINPQELVGDLHLRTSDPSMSARLAARLNTVLGHLADAFDHRTRKPPTLLALDSTGDQPELLLGRDLSCDVRLPDLTVSRRHARLICRDGRWVIQDLESTNGTIVNGRRVGRCEVRPGDDVKLGDERLRID